MGIQFLEQLTSSLSISLSRPDVYSYDEFFYQACFMLLEHETSLVNNCIRLRLIPL